MQSAGSLYPSSFRISEKPIIPVIPNAKNGCIFIAEIFR